MKVPEALSCKQWDTYFSSSHMSCRSRHASCPEECLQEINGCQCCKCASTSNCVDGHGQVPSHIIEHIWSLQCSFQAATKQQLRENNRASFKIRQASDCSKLFSNCHSCIGLECGRMAYQTMIWSWPWSSRARLALCSTLFRGDFWLIRCQPQPYAFMNFAITSPVTSSKQSMSNLCKNSPTSSQRSP